MMVNVHGQSDWVQSRLGDIPQGRSVRELSRGEGLKGKSHHDCGSVILGLGSLTE